MKELDCCRNNIPPAVYNVRPIHEMPIPHLDQHDTDIENISHDDFSPSEIQCINQRTPEAQIEEILVPNSGQSACVNNEAENFNASISDPLHYSSLNMEIDENNFATVIQSSSQNSLANETANITDSDNHSGQGANESESNQNMQ